VLLAATAFLVHKCLRKPGNRRKEGENGKKLPHAGEKALPEIGERSKGRRVCRARVQETVYRIRQANRKRE